jgi:GNAT superfamily N-acetyltransferase
MAGEIDIRPLAAEDAAKLTDCFERCYGDSYVVGFFYDPEAIRARMVDGRVYSVVALTAEGEIVGHMAMMRPHSGALTVELGNTIVDPRYRGHGLAARLGAALFEACRVGGYVGFHHYPTTAHAIMQKLAVQAGGVETGVMLSYSPAGTDYRDLGGKSDQGRLAVVVVYQPLAPAPARDVFLPARYEAMLCEIYGRAGLERGVSAPAGAIAGASTRLRSRLDARRGLLRIEVESAGSDLEAFVDGLLREQLAEVAQVDLRLSDPGVGAAVEVLRELGFFFCAILPEFAASDDVLRLQRVAVESSTLPDLVFAEARGILDAALADRTSRPPRETSS